MAEPKVDVVKCFGDDELAQHDVSHGAIYGFVQYGVCSNQPAHI